MQSVNGQSCPECGEAIPKSEFYARDPICIFAGVAKTSPRSDLHFCQVGILCPRFGLHFCQVCNEANRIQFVFLQGCRVSDTRMSRDSQNGPEINKIGESLSLFRDFPYDCIENITIFAV